MPTIKVATPVQKTLLECELKGQMSDGHWENANPHNHWKVPCSATVVVDTTKQGIDFYSRKYNFNNSMLIEIIGDRMLMFARARIQYPDVSDEAIRALDNGDWIWTDGKSGTHYREKLTEFGITSKAEADDLKEILKTMAQIEYTIKDLRKDLKALSIIFRSHT